MDMEGLHFGVLVAENNCSAGSS